MMVSKETEMSVAEQPGESIQTFDHNPAAPIKTNKPGSQNSQGPGCDKQDVGKRSRPHAGEVIEDRSGDSSRQESGGHTYGNADG